MTAAWCGVTRGESMPRAHTARHTHRRRRPAPRMTAGRRSDWICVTRGSRTNRPTPGPRGLLPAGTQLPSSRVARIAVIGLTVADVIVLPDSEPREATGGGTAVRGAGARGPARATSHGGDALPRRPARGADPPVLRAPLPAPRRDLLQERAALPAGRRAGARARRPRQPVDRRRSRDGSPPTVLRDATWVHAATQGSRDFGPGGAQGARTGWPAPGARRAGAAARGEARPAAPDRRAGRRPARARAGAQAVGGGGARGLRHARPDRDREAHRRRGGARDARSDRRAGRRGTRPRIRQLEPRRRASTRPGAGDSFLALYADGRAEGLSPLAAADAACADVSAVLAARLAASSGSIGRGRPVSQS